MVSRETVMGMGGMSNEVLMPELEICDPHLHLWKSASQDYLVDAYLSDMADGHRVTSSIYVECRSGHWDAMYRTAGPAKFRPIGETEFIVAITPAAKGGVAAAIVGYVDLRLGREAGDVLDLQAELGDGRFRGIRQGASWDEDPQIVGIAPPVGPGLYRRPDFREGMRELTKRGMTFDAWLYQTQQDDLIELASVNPDQPIVVNHCGGVLGINRYRGRQAEMFADWKAKMSMLARLPNVSMKLGGLGMYRSGLDFGSPTKPMHYVSVAETIRPWIETCIGLFGPSRCMFEGNFPVDRASYSYLTMWNAFKYLTQDFSAEEQALLFSGSAKRFYRLKTTRPDDPGVPG